MSPRAVEYLVWTWRLVTGARAKSEREVAKERQRDVLPYVPAAGGMRVLDLANGRLRPQYLLLKADGEAVVGLDEVNGRNGWSDVAYALARRLYAGHLEWRGRRRGMTLVGGDATVLPFGEEVFDLVTSIAAFEHFLDVPAVVAELHRVMRPGAVAWIRIHLFTCPSGGHNVSATEIPLRTVPRGVDPWDHLRRRRLPFSVPLNEWRVGQYLDAFARHFEIVKHYCAMREGEALLTPAIEAELAGYTRDELTCGAYVIVARKRA